MAKDIGFVPVVTLEFSALERGYLVLAVQNQINVYRRALSKEVPGSEIQHLRTGELNAMLELQRKLSV